VTAWIIVVALVLLIWLALLQPIWVILTISPDQTKVSIRYIGLRFQPSSSKHGAKKSNEEKKRKSGGPKPPTEWIRLFPRLIEALKRSIRYLLNRIKLKKLELQGTLGVEDPIQTGLLIAAAHTIKQFIPDREGFVFNLTPDFIDGETQIWGDFESGIRPTSIINSGLVLLWHLPKVKILKLIRQK
jgi:hypothetical protein